MSMSDPVATTPGQEAYADWYGADIMGVRAYIPLREISYDTAPSEPQVEHMIHNIASQVALTIGDLDHLSGKFLGDVLRNARACVEMGTAAWVQDSSYPERTDAQDSSSWGAVLLKRYNDMLQALAVTVSRGPVAPDTGTLYPDLGCAWLEPLDPLIADVGGLIVQDWSDPYAYRDGLADEIQTEINEESGFDDGYNGGVGFGGQYEDVG